MRFNLTAAAETLIQCLIKLPEAREKDLDQLNQDIARQRRLLNVRYFDPDQINDSVFFACDIFAAMSLFPNGVDRPNLIKLFKPAKRPLFDQAITLLINNDVVENRNGIFVQKCQELNFKTSSNQFNYTQLMKLAVHESTEAIDSWYNDPQRSCFAATSLSVKLADLSAKMKKLRDDLERVYTELEDPNGDCVIKFNVHVFPLVMQNIKPDLSD